MNKSPRNRLVAHLRLLCSMEADATVALPRASEALRELAGADWSGFIWANEQAEPEALHTDNPAVFDSWPRFEALRQSGEVGRVIGDFRDWVMAGTGVNSALLDQRHYQTSQLFEEVVRPTHTGHFCSIVVGAGPRRGVVLLGRGPREKGLDPEALQLVAALRPHLAQALARQTRPSPTAADGLHTDGTAFLLVNEDGRVLDRSAGASQLLAKAQDRTLGGNADTPLPDAAMHTLDRLQRIRDGRPSLPACVVSTNRWGRFAWRAYLMEGKLTDGTPMAGPRAFATLHVEHQVPSGPLVARGAYALGLSPQLQAVSMRIASGTPHARIAQELNIKLNTVVDHRRSIYARLGVQDAAELKAHLMEAGRQ